MISQAPESRLKIISYAALFTSVVFSIAGQLLMKFAMSSKEGFLVRPFPLQLILALVIYSFGVVNWVVALRYVKLSIAYPLTSLNYIGILLGSYYFFNEKVTLTRIVGVLLVFAGVLLVAVPMRQLKYSEEGK